MDVEELLAALDLSDLAEHPFSELSGGQRQRVLISRALACDPRLLLLDEPSANIDLEGGAKLAEILARLRERMPILIVSHDVSFVSSLVGDVLCVNRTLKRHPLRELTGGAIRDLYRNDMLAWVRHDTVCGGGEAGGA